MADDLFSFELAENFDCSIKVIGIGGGGSNAVNHMYKQGIQNVDFMICNTDAQALASSPVPIKIQLGSSLTGGRGAGNKPQVAREAAKENIEDVMSAVGDNTNMVFITAGMGGGTGTGATPVIAEATRHKDILTVGIVTLPFSFEGKTRIRQAREGIKELSEHVDSLLIINNEKLRDIYGGLNITDCFAKADDILKIAAKGIAEIITIHGKVNVDFADVQTVMKDSGISLMGSSTAKGEGRALQAVEAALTSPLLNNNDIHGAQNILLNIRSGIQEATMEEIGQINEYVQEAAGLNADLIWGCGVDESLGDEISVTVIATGFKKDSIDELLSDNKQKKVDLKTDDYDLDSDGNLVFDLTDDAPKKEEPKPAPVVENKFPKESLWVDEQSSPNSSPFTNNFEQFGEPEMSSSQNFEMKSSADINTTEAEQEIARLENIQTATNTQQETKQAEPDYKFDPLQYINNVTRFEDEPAYKRKGVNLNMNFSPGVEISRYKLSTDGNKQTIKLGQNSYLNNKPD